MTAAVRLIGITRPVIDEIPGTAEMLAWCARVSSTANQNKHETGGRLLRSLVRRNEWSPLEMVSLTIEINTTRDIARQILRHRSFSFQEYSQRYAEVTDAPVFRQARMQDHKDRQNSIATDDRLVQLQWQSIQDRVATLSRDAYEAALEIGIAKEVARAVLPEGMTPSRLYMAGTLRSWIHYCDLRCDPKTQLEHRVIATACREVLIEQFPDLADVQTGAGQ